jgi:transposase, IS5 family
LKQTFAAQSKELERKAGGHAHAKQFKRLKKVLKHQRAILGVVMRQLQCKLDTLTSTTTASNTAAAPAATPPSASEFGD